MPTLEWIGKDKVINHHQNVPYRVLEEKYTYNAEQSDNMIIRGDNLEALKALLPLYEGKIKCIYIDPPYNTGNENWVYNDNVNDPKIKKWLGEVVGKEGEDLSRHDKWLCMMYPRLKLLQRLLANDGAIFISIDDNEQANLKLLCDEIFGVGNCIGPFIQNKMNSKNDTTNVQKNHEFILCYRKSVSYINGTKIKPTLKNIDEKEKKVYEENGEYYYLNDSITTRGDGGILNARTNLGYTVYYNPATKDKIAVCDYDIDLAKTFNSINELYQDDRILLENGYIPIRAPLVRGKLGCWTWSLEKFNNEKRNIAITGVAPNYAVKKRTFISKDDVTFVDGNMKYLTSNQGNSRSILDFSTNDGTTELKSIMNESNTFENPKNVEMIQYLISLLADDDSIILDSFAGSGTTAQAVLNLNKSDGGNRKFILVEMMDYAESITAERIKRVISGYKADKKYILFDKNITITCLKNGTQLIEEANEVYNSALEKYSNVKKPKLSDGHLQVVAVQNAEDEIDGLGGNFTFYDLGEPLLIDNNQLNEKVDTQKIREYVWFMETKKPFCQNDKYDNEFFLGVNNDNAYYFYYEKEKITTLNNKFLATVKTKADTYIIYADKCTYSDEALRKYNITFKKIPRDISKL